MLTFISPRERLTFISRREMLTFTSLREMVTFISLRSIKFATHQIPPLKNLVPDTWPHIRFHQGKARAPTQIPPREKLAPRRLGLIPLRRKLGPMYLCPSSTREKTRAQVLGTKFPRYGSPVSRQSSCLCAPISSSLCHLPGFTMFRRAPPLGPLSARSRHDSQLLSFVERVLRRISSVFAPKSALATRWPDATESSVGIAQRMRRGIN